MIKQIIVIIKEQVYNIQALIILVIGVEKIKVQILIETQIVNPDINLGLILVYIDLYLEGGNKILVINIINTKA